MTAIERNPQEASGQEYDLIVIGGGIYGVMLTFVATQVGLRPLLLEKNDFGGATSFNSLRIVHGGFRYLQSADLHRFYESVNERRWFFQHFAGLVKPLPCLLPLYGKGVYRPSVFRVALKLNDVLSFRRNENVAEDCLLPGGKVLAAKEVVARFPKVKTEGLKGGAVWYDGAMPDSQRILMEVLKWAVSLGAVALNYVEVAELRIQNDCVTGVHAIDKVQDTSLSFAGRAVVNAAGPWSRQVAAKFDRDVPELFRSSLAWNVLFDREQLSDHALAVTPDRPHARTYFLHPWKGKLLAGTGHAPWNGISQDPLPPEEALEEFIEDLNLAVPGLDLSRRDILHIFSGLLPVVQDGTTELAVREKIIDHGASGGVRGLFSVSGVKFTTSRLVAEKTMQKIFPGTGIKPAKILFDKPDYRGIPKEELGIFEYDWYPPEADDNWMTCLKKIAQTESVVHLDDLIFRRTTIGDNPRRAMQLAPRLCSLFSWDKKRCLTEIKRIAKHYKGIKFSDTELSPVHS